MAGQHQKTIVGVLALTSILLVGIMVVMFGGGRTLFAETYDLHVQFLGGVVGVQDGQGVTLSGKRIGETKKVEFWNENNLSEGIRVIVAVETEYTLPAASHIEVVTSIMGFGRPTIRIVVDEPEAAGTMPTDGSAMIQGRMLPMLDQVFSPKIQDTLLGTTADIGKLAAALAPVATKIEELLEHRDIKDVDMEKVTANMATVIARLDDTIKNVNAIVGDPDNQQNLKAFLANSRKMTETGVKAMERGTEAMENVRDLSEAGNQIVADAGQLLRSLTGSVDQMSRVLSRLDQTLAALNSKTGTAGLLLNDNRLYEELLLSAKRLTKTLDDAREVMDIIKRGDLEIKGKVF